MRPSLNGWAAFAAAGVYTFGAAALVQPEAGLYFRAPSGDTGLRAGARFRGALDLGLSHGGRRETWLRSRRPRTRSRRLNERGPVTLALPRTFQDSWIGSGSLIYESFNSRQSQPALVVFRQHSFDLQV